MVNAMTGNLYGASQSPYYGTNPNLVISINNIRHSAELISQKRSNSVVRRELRLSSFSPRISTGCLTQSAIDNVFIQATGTDGWYVTSISTYIASSDRQYGTKLTSDPSLNKWIDSDEETKYNYNAKLVPLTLLTKPTKPNTVNLDDCITKFKISAQTGSERGAGFSSTYMEGRTHHVVLTLRNSGVLQADLPSPAYTNWPYSKELDFSSAFSTGGKCVTKGDIIQVKLKAGGNDGWYTTYITTYVKTGTGSYQELTNNSPFNRWLDGDEESLYPNYNAKEQILSLLMQGIVDTPKCGYGIAVCECNENAATCVLNLEIDEIMTFTSYKKFEVGLREGLAVRGTQGVIFSIDEESGKTIPHPAYEKRHCADKKNRNDCTDPQYVDGKTYRMAVGVNGQIPGPTLIVHEGQTVVIHVHNNMSTEGVSIHWHGMHQTGSPWMDGVGQVTQCQIGPSTSFTYMYVASPSGTFWYHSHSGAQRTDGFFGALIVKETELKLRRVKSELQKRGVQDFEDLPEQHTITLLDWQHESSLETFSQLNAGLGFYQEIPVGEVPSPCSKRYDSTRSIERAEVGPVPYFSGLINGKGRHNDVPYSKTRLSVFTVEEGKQYRFRLIGAQGLYAYKFSIDGHKLTVVNTDGYWIIPQESVDFIMIHTGERYDFIVEAKQDAPTKKYWMRAETLEINPKGRPPYQSLGHVAEGILQYKKNGEAIDEIDSTEYEEIKLSSETVKCSESNKCRAINCPFENFQELYYTDCINVDKLQLLEETPASQLPRANPSSDCPDNNCRHFINFNFEGDSETSAINGRNFILPPVPPQTQNEEFQKQAIQCNRNENCNPANLNCMCTHVIDIPYKKTIQFVLTALGAYDNAHPIHLHGHTFHVVKVGYPSYDSNTGFIAKKDTLCNNTQISVHNPDISCDDSCDGNPCPTESGCNPNRCTKPRWTNNPSPSLTINSRTIRKDTVMVPAGGYVVINFISDNPGHWFLHCHIEVHQLEGMALIVNEAFKEQQLLKVPEGVNQCGDFSLTVDGYKKLLLDSQQKLAAVAK